MSYDVWHQRDDLAREVDRLREDVKYLQAGIVELEAERDRLLKEKNAALGAFHKDCRKERDRLRGEVKEWLCTSCNTVYPGPPQRGVRCVICPLCGGNTGPLNIVQREKAEAERDRLREQLAGAMEGWLAMELDRDRLREDYAEAQAGWDKVSDENDRLREALERIAGQPFIGPVEPTSRFLARQALRGTNDE